MTFKSLRQVRIDFACNHPDTGAWQRWCPTGERYDSEGNLRLLARSSERAARFYGYRAILQETPQRDLDGFEGVEGPRE